MESSAEMRRNGKQFDSQRLGDVVEKTEDSVQKKQSKKGGSNGKEEN